MSKTNKRYSEPSLRQTGMSGDEKAMQVLRWMEHHPWCSLREVSEEIEGFNKYVWLGIRHLFDSDKYVETNQVRYKRNNEPLSIVLKAAHRRKVEGAIKCRKLETLKTNEKPVEYTQDDGFDLVQSIINSTTRGLRTTWRFIRNPLH